LNKKKSLFNVKIMLDIILPIQTVSEGNCSEHWSKKNKRHKIQKKKIWICFKTEKPEITLPCQIRLTRIAPRALDYDNLVYSLKWVHDAICDNILPGLAPGRADGDKRFKQTEYFQEKGKPKQYLVRIEIVENCL